MIIDKEACFEAAHYSAIINQNQQQRNFWDMSTAW